VLANDSVTGGALDLSTLEIVSGPSNALSATVHNGHIHYQSTVGFIGTDVLVYRVCTIDGLCDTATVLVRVDPTVVVPPLCADFPESTIMYSLSPDRSNPQPLDGADFFGAEFFGQIFIFATIPQATEQVGFFVNDTGQIREPLNVESTCTYDMEIADTDGPRRGIGFSEFGNGSHSVSIERVANDGTISTVDAFFEIDIPGGANSANPELTPVVGGDCPRARDGDLLLSNADLRNCNFTGIDLAGANLSSANLRGAYLAFTNLAGANLTSADLSRATIDQANLTNSNLAKITGNNLWFTDSAIQGVILSDSVLAGANLNGSYGVPVQLLASDFAGAICPDGTVSTGPTCWP